MSGPDATDAGSREALIALLHARHGDNDCTRTADAILGAFALAAPSTPTTEGLDALELLLGETEALPEDAPEFHKRAMYAAGWSERAQAIRARLGERP